MVFLRLIRALCKVVNDTQLVWGLTKKDTLILAQNEFRIVGSLLLTDDGTELGHYWKGISFGGRFFAGTGLAPIDCY